MKAVGGLRLQKLLAKETAKAIHIKTIHIKAAHIKAAHVKAAHIEATCIKAAHIETIHIRAAHIETAQVKVTHIEAARAIERNRTIIIAASLVTALLTVIAERQHDLVNNAVNTCYVAVVLLSNDNFDTEFLT